MTNAAPAPAYDPRRIEEIRTANETSKGYIGRRGFCEDCDFLLSAIDQEKRKVVDQALALAYARHFRGGIDYGPDEFMQPILDRLFPPTS
jgi:hypothetical protein